MKAIGVGLVITSVLTVAAMWLYPIGVNNPSYRQRTCTPIVEMIRRPPAGTPMGLDLCYLPSRRRVRIAAAGGLVLGMTGLAVLVLGWGLSLADADSPDRHD